MADALDLLTMWARRNTSTKLSATAVGTLDTLRRAGPMRISELAAVERVSQPGMTGLVNRLTAAGHAERVEDARDGRATLVRITESGVQALAQRHAIRSAALLGHLRELPAEHQRALLAALPALRELCTYEGER